MIYIDNSNYNIRNIAYIPDLRKYNLKVKFNQNRDNFKLLLYIEFILYQTLLSTHGF